MSLLSAFAHTAWMLTSLPAWHRFRKALDQPDVAQWKILQRLLTQNASCAYGQAFVFAGISNYKHFCEHVPISDYEDLQPWITRIMHGESHVLTNDEVSRLLPTSGSSGGRKLIPFTAILQTQFNAAINPWMVDLFINQPSLIFSSTYWSISPAISHANEEQSKIPIGFDDDSQYLGDTRRKFAEATFAVPSILRLVGDNECFRYLTVLCLLRHQDLGLVSVWHPSFLDLLLETMTDCWNELLTDVGNGTCPRASGLCQEVQVAIFTKPMPVRAKALSQTSPQNLLSIWPRLKVISCWGDGQSVSALRDLQMRHPQVCVQAKGLLATEAFVSIPFQGLHPLAVRSHFYEFAHANGQIYRGHELQPGERYSVIVTTGGGLWRYRMGDLVEVDGFIGKTPSIKFIGREGSVSDFFGEKLTEIFVTQAITNAVKTHNFTPVFAMLSPDFNAAGARCYTLYVEGEIPAGLASSLENELKQNPHYQLCRHLRQLGYLRCFHITENAHSAYFDAISKSGQRLGDIKPQTLSMREDWKQFFVGRYVEYKTNQ